MLGGCATEIASTTTPDFTGVYGKHDAALDHAIVGGLLDNVLRARDHLPPSFTDVTSITNQFSEQVTNTVTLPLGIQSSISRTTAPALTASSSPTATISSLNTQAFWTNIVQPTPATWIKSLWVGDDAPFDPKARTGAPTNRLLFMLLVKSIKLPGLDSSYQNQEDDTVFNNPDSPREFSAFLKLADVLFTQGHARLALVQIEEPVGPPIKVGETNSVQTTDYLPSPNATKQSRQSTTARDLGWITTVTGANDGSYHLGNEDCDKDACHEIQLYRQFASQPVLCVDHQTMQDLGYTPYKAAAAARAKEEQARESAPPIPKKTEPAGPKPAPLSKAGEAQIFGDFEDQLATVDGRAAFMVGGGGHGGGGGAQGAGGGQQPGAAPSAASPAATGGGGSGTQPATAAAVIRVSAIVSPRFCSSPEHVESPISERDFAKGGSSFAQIEWRSPIEVLEYLGAIARFGGLDNCPQDDNKVTARLASTTGPDGKPVSVELVCWQPNMPLPLVLRNYAELNDYDTRWDEERAQVSARYGQQRYFVADDISKQSFSLLANLLNSAKGTNAPPTLLVGTP